MKEMINLEKIYEFDKTEATLFDVIKFKNEIPDKIKIKDMEFKVLNKSISNKEFSYSIICELLLG